MFVTVSLAFVMIMLMTITLSNLRQEAIGTHRHIANLHAYTFEEHFSQMLQHVSFSIDRIAVLSENEQVITPLLTELIHDIPYIRSLSLLDLNGTIVASSFQQNIAKKVPLDNFLPIPFLDMSLLRIGVPWLGRDFDSAHPSQMHHPIAANQLSFLPIIKKIYLNHAEYYIAASLNMEYLHNRYTAVLPFEQGSVFLWRSDGILLFSTHPEERIGISHYSPSHPANQEDFYDHIMQNSHEALNVFRTAHLFPFVVEIKTNEDNALGYWDKERQKVLWLSGFLILFAGLLALTLILRYMKENERQKRQLAYEMQFRIAMEATQTGVWTWDLITNEVTWDSQCFKLLGYEANAFEVTLEKIYQLTHPDESMMMFFSIKEQILTQGSLLVERRMKNAHNEWTWVQVRGKVIEYTQENEPLLLTGVYINIDAQKKMENLHLSAVAFETQEAILITDTNEVVLKVNEAFTRITGYSDTDIIGKTPRLLRSDKHDKAFYQAMWHELKTKGFWQGELWNKRKNGEIYAEFLTITAIKNTDGAVTHYIANFNDITVHKHAQQVIQEMAYYDPLTHLANRRLLDETMQSLLKDSPLKKQYSAVIFIDLDYFKELNDTYGHDAGDMLLVQVATRLKDATRQSDLVVRLGGDEFVVLLANLGHQKKIAHYMSMMIAQKILALLCEPYALTQGNYTLGASLGCTLFAHDDTKDESTILKEADLAMYKAKENGRNQVSFYETDPI